MEQSTIKTKDSANAAVAQFDAMTGLRALAALGVLFCHFSEIDADKNNYFHWGILDPLLIHGAIGVDVFFVLSGFILTYVYCRKFAASVKSADYKGFMKYRFARLYPVHLVTMSVMLVLFFAGKRLGTVPHHLEAFSPVSILANLTMTHAWFPGLASAMNGPAWSISAEWFAYLLFPFVYFLFKRTGDSWPWVVVALACLSAFTYQGGNHIVQICIEFPVGMAAFEIYSQRKISTGRFGSLLAVAMILFSTFVLAATDPLAPLRITTGGHLRTGVILSTVVLLIGLTSKLDLLGRILSTKFWFYAGEISYSVYMCHWAVWTTLHKGLPHFRAFAKLPHPAIMSLAAVLTIICSIVCYHFVEVPGRALIRNLHLDRVKSDTKLQPLEAPSRS
jgi:peptidoglycan/LPS O-acetylase OafA/YrhL